MFSVISTSTSTAAATQQPLQPMPLPNPSRHSISTDLLDPSTWGEYRFHRAEDMIWNSIASRAAHQQRVENLVQTAGHLGKTHVEEARRLARAKIHCIFYRDFNAWALQIIRNRDEAKLLAALQTNKKVAVITDVAPRERPVSS
jgi:hypothetical protein